VIEAAQGLEAVRNNATLAVSITETATGTATVSARFFWEPIDDLQTANWTIVVDTQTAGWTIINTQ
jgi:hypothetical protein